MSRRQAREIAMQALFQLDMNPPNDETADEAMQNALSAAMEIHSSKKKNIAEGKDGWDENPTYEYANSILKGTITHRNEIDDEIASVSKEWRLDRMAGIDRAILRLAVCEMRYSEDVTPGIVINEAVELAKKFGTDKSGRFVNGVLASLVK
ncbi:MAG: transcription antitermination factor NusB [Schwartzia sp.]|nr:transcription antitermination factor NusB [Schwartzia sp. (in: firmicutes)]